MQTPTAMNNPPADNPPVDNQGVSDGAAESGAGAVDSSPPQTTEASGATTPADTDVLDAADEALADSLNTLDDLIAPWIEWLPEWARNEYTGAAAIVIVSIVAAGLVRWVANAIIGSWFKRTQNPHDDQLLDIFRRPLFLTVILAGLALATKLLDLGPLPEKITLAVLKTFAVFIWIIFAIRFSKFILTILSKYHDRFQLVQERTVPLFENIAALAFFGIGAYFLFLAWDIDVTAWLASAGIIGLAVSFAAKDTLSNLFAGVFILADAPYAIGDFIVLDSGERGCVTQIGLRSTRLLTRDDVEVTIPNSVMGSSKIVNETAGPHPKFRIRVKVGVAYGSDIERVKDVLLDVGMKHPDACQSPEPRVRFRGFGDSSLDLELLCWIEEPVLRGRSIDALNTEVYKRFTSEGIEIPFPQRDVHLKGTTENASPSSS
ncbi:MAG: mechanosensitive ion channel family protein [Planctomycetota bacterium]